MVFQTRGLAVGIAVASLDAVAIGFGTDKVWDGLRIFGDIRGEAVDFTDTVILQSSLWNVSSTVYV